MCINTGICVYGCVYAKVYIYTYVGCPSTEKQETFVSGSYP